MNRLTSIRSLTAFIRAVGVMAMLGPAAGFGQPAWQPARAVEIVVGTAPGSGPDHTARMIQDILRVKEMVPVPTAVVSRAGGGGSVGWTYLNRHPGDGHFLMIGSANLSISYLTGTSTISYRDLTTIALLSHDYLAILVRADSPIKDGKDLLARLKKDPASASFAISAVAGSTSHIAAGLVLKAGGVDLKKVRTVIFDSSGKSITALLGGHVDVAVGAVSQSLAQARDGKTRILGYSAPRRLGGELANIPTWQEQGAKMEFSNYRTIVGPRGMPKAQIDYWENVFAELDKDERWHADLQRNNQIRDFLGSAAARAYLDSLAGTTKPIVEELGLVK